MNNNVTLQDLGKVAYFNRGEFNASVNYEINDVVSFNGSSYVSVENNNQGNVPNVSQKWNLVASKGEKGDTGKAFIIEKTYQSIQEMVADYDNMQINDYVMISGNIEDQDNATLWTKTDTEVSPYKWVYLADFSGATGITGATPNIQIGTVEEGNQPSVTRRTGSTNENPILDFVLKTGAKGDTGNTGNGISSVEKTGTSGLVDTYTIHFTNGNNTTFQINNGKGIANISKTSTSGLVDTYTITYNDGTTSTFDITNGEDGEVTQAQLDQTNTELASLRTVFNALPKASDEDTEITLNDTANVVFDELTLKGNAEQKVIHGNQLMDFSNPTYASGITYSFVNDILTMSNSTAGSYRALAYNATNIVLNNPGKTLYFDFEKYESAENIDGSRARLMVYYNDGTANKSNTLLDRNLNKISYKIPDDVSNIQRVSFDIWLSTETSLLNTVTITKPMLQFGTDKIDYEPYTGGETSPSPDNPSDVKVVTGDNKIEINRKNMLDNNSMTKLSTNIDTIENGVITTKTLSSWDVIRVNINDIKLKSNEEYYVTFQAKIISGTGELNYGGNLGDGNNYATQISITNPQLTSSYQTYCWKISTTGDDFIGNIMLFQVGNSTTNLILSIKDIIFSKTPNDTYVPYQSQNYTIPLGSMELCKIGEYEDYIFKNEVNSPYYNSELVLNKWYKHKEIEKYTFTGNENWSVQASDSNLTTFNGSSILANAPAKASNYQQGLCISNYFKPAIDWNIWTNVQTGIDAYINRVLLTISSSIATTVSELNEWLSENVAIIYYPLETPENEVITNTTLINQLEAIHNAMSYQGQTNISSEYTDGNAQMIIKASAVKDVSSILTDLETRIAELETV